MSLRVRAAQSLIWTTLESGGLTILSFITLVVVARLITPAELGVVTVSLGLIQLLTLPVEIFFHDALVQRDDTNDNHYNTAHTTSFAAAILISTCIWLSSASISKFTGYEQSGLILSILSLSLIFSSFGSSLVARQRREFKFKVLAIRSVLGRLIGALAGIGAAALGAGLWSLVVQQIVMTGCSTLFLWIFADNRPVFSIKFAFLRDMSLFGLSSLINNLLILSESRLFILLIAYWHGATVAGYFNLAFRIVDMPRDVVSGAANQLALPLFRQVISQGEGLKSAYNEAVSFTCLLGYPLFIGIAVCAPELVKVVFGPKWIDAAPFVSFFAALTIAFFPKLYGGTVLIAKGVPHLFTPVLIISLMTIIVGMITIGQRSVWLASCVWAARIITSMPFEIYFLYKVASLTIRDQFRATRVPLCATVLMGIIVVVFKSQIHFHVSEWINLLVLAFIGATTYVTVVFIFDRENFIKLAEFGLLMRRKNKVM